MDNGNHCELRLTYALKSSRPDEGAQGSGEKHGVSKQRLPSGVLSALSEDLVGSGVGFPRFEQGPT
eukprot:1686060-Pyramimonas_sp.AAC.1